VGLEECNEVVTARKLLNRIIHTLRDDIKYTINANSMEKLQQLIAQCSSIAPMCLRQEIIGMRNKVALITREKQYVHQQQQQLQYEFHDDILQEEQILSDTESDELEQQTEPQDEIENERELKSPTEIVLINNQQKFITTFICPTTNTTNIDTKKEMEANNNSGMKKMVNVMTTGSMKKTSTVNRKKKTVTLMEFFPAQFINTELKLPKHKRYKHSLHHKKREYQKDNNTTLTQATPSCTTIHDNIHTITEQPSIDTADSPTASTNSSYSGSTSSTPPEFNEPDYQYQKFDITQLDSILANQQQPSLTTEPTITNILSLPQYTTLDTNIQNHNNIDIHIVTAENLNTTLQKHDHMQIKQHSNSNSTHNSGSIATILDEEDSDDDDLCCICFDKPNFVWFSPCMHTSCADCANRLRYQTIFRYESGTRCPFCRSVVKAFYLLMQQN